MNRFWIGICILCILLILGAAVTWAMGAIHIPISLQLQAAQDAAMQNDWSEAITLATVSRQRWETWYNFTAAFADHGPMDEITSLFAELEVYAAEQDAAHFSALCGNLSRLEQAMAESHCPSWWNFL